MGVKLLWTGLAFIELVLVLGFDKRLAIGGPVVMGIGCVLMWMDK